MDVPTRQLLGLLRIAAAALVPIFMFAWSWAGRDASTQTDVYFFAQIAALLLFAVFPRKGYQEAAMRRGAQIIAALAIAAAVPKVIGDLSAPIEPNVNAAVVRIFICGLLIAMLLEARAWRPSSEPSNSTPHADAREKDIASVESTARAPGERGR